MLRQLLAPAEVPSNCPKYWEKLVYPLLGSPKLDGIRGTNGPDGVMMSRKWLPIPSQQCQDVFSHIPWTDGELIEGDPTDPAVYNRTQSFVMSANKLGNMSYHVFDYADPSMHDDFYEKRLNKLEEVIKGDDRFTLVEQTLLETYNDVIEFENERLEDGYEGIMLRTPWGRYKNGRATINEGIIYKLKRFVDAEGVIVGFVERQTNTNEKLRDEQGYAKRSSSIAGKQAAGTLGKFKVSFEGNIINVAPGLFSHAELQEIWDNQEKYLNQLLKFRYFAHGIKDQPRHARAIGFRSKIDT